VAVLAVFCGTLVKAEAPAAPAQRQEQEKAAEQKLTELDKKMNELSSDVKKAEGSTQAEMNKLYEEFKKQQRAAKSSLEELRKSTNETWDKSKTGMDKALENLNGLYERSKAKSKGTARTRRSKGQAMDLFDAIKGRTSIRRFKQTPVPDEDIGHILDAGRLAPSPNNTQPWSFLVIKDRAVLQQMAEAVREMVDRMIPMPRTTSRPSGWPRTGGPTTPSSRTRRW